MFLQVSVCPQGGRVSASVHAGMPDPPDQADPPDQVDTPVNQADPLDQADPPRPGRHTPGTRQTPPGTKQTPPDQADTPLPLGSRLQHTVYEWPVCILLECILVTRMHSSRMHTDRWLPISPGMHCSRGVVGGGVPSLGGVYLVWGVCTWSGGCVPGPRGVYLVPGGVYLVPGGVYLVLGGVPGPGGCTWSREVYLPRYSTPVDRITDACENITLPQLRCGR